MKHIPGHPEPRGDLNKCVKMWLVCIMVGEKEELGVNTSWRVSPVSAMEGLDKSHYPHP